MNYFYIIAVCEWFQMHCCSFVGCYEKIKNHIKTSSSIQNLLVVKNELQMIFSWLPCEWKNKQASDLS